MSKHLKWVYSFSVKGWVSHSQCVLQLMNYYIKMPEMGVSILSDGVDKPFSAMQWVSHSQCVLQLIKYLLSLGTTKILCRLTLTSVTSNKSSLGVYKVLLTRYFFTSNMTFSMLLLLTFTAPSVIAFVYLFQATLEIG